MNTIEYGSLTADTNLGPTPSIWADCPVLELIENPAKGIYMMEDFMGWNGTVTSNVGTYFGDAGGYKSFEDTSQTLLQLTGFPTGVLRATMAATDNVEVGLEWGAGVATTGAFKFTTGTGPKLWFEARFRISVISNTYNLFVGLAQSALAVTDGLFTDSDAANNVSKIGFDVLAAAGDTLRAVHGDSAAAAVNVGTAQTLVAATWYKVGFIADPNGRAGKKVRWFIDGVEVQSITDSSISTFPSGDQLTPLFVVKQSGTVAKNLDIDFIRCAQLA